MLHLLQPIWMILTAGITIPLFIHLWHRRPGKVLKVGSIQLLTATSVRHARSRHISDWWLLILRCLLILLLALLLSQPVWRQPLNTRNTKGWVIVEPLAYKPFQSQVDSLVQAGYQLHGFDTGFAHLRSINAIMEDTAQIPYWELLRLLSAKIPAGLPVYLFTGNQLQRFRGTKPTIALNLRWKTISPPDSVNNWDAYTYPLATDSQRVIKGRSTPAGTVFYSRDTAAGKDTATLYCTIYTDKYPSDARYLSAALQAVQQYTQRKIKITTVRQPAQVPSSQDWLWWLSDQQVPASVRAGETIAYATGEPQNSNAFIPGTGIKIFKRITTTDTSAAIWKDAYGMPLLTRQRLYTHLDPAWNGLVWSAEFPQWLLEILFPQKEDQSHDRRVIDPLQLQVPAPAPGTRVNAGISPVNTTRLDKLTWIILFLLFCVERYVALKTKKITPSE